MLKYCVTSLFFTYSYLSSASTEVPLTLEIVEDESRHDISMSITYFGSDRDTSTITGTIDVVLAFDSMNEVVTKFSMTGGEVEFSPAELGFSYEGATLDVDFSTLIATTDSLDGEEVLFDGTGTLDPSKHQLVFTSGTATLVSEIPRQGRDRTVIDITEPDSGDGIDPESIAVTEGLEISVEKIESSERSATWEATLTAEGKITNSETEDGITISLTSDILFKASSLFVLPTDFGDWLTEQSLSTEATSQTMSGQGIPFALLHAFNLSPEARSLPFVSPNRSGGGNMELIVTCPEDGLRRPVVVRSSGSLEPEAKLKELAVLPIGTVGEQVIQFSEGDKAFARLYTE